MSDTSGATLTAVELFCGPGGFATGFGREGISVLFANDIDENTAETYRANHPDTSVVQGDIRNISVDNIEKSIDDNHGDSTSEDLDIVVGGPPCEGFSLAGDRDPDDPRNDLFEEYLRVVEGLRPKVIVMENVRGILSMRDGEVADAILSELADLGYIIDEPWQLTADDFGVPQTRTRVFFVAVREDVSEEPVPEPEPTGKTVTVWDALSDLPNLSPGEGATEYDEPWFTEYQRELRANVERDGLTHHESTNHKAGTVMRFKLTPPGGNPWSFPDEYDEYRPSKVYESRHNKLVPSEPSPTITSHVQGERVHYEQPRIVTVREAARLQSFPDDYVFCGPRALPHHVDDESQYEQVGNAVPPKLAEHIAAHLKEQVLAER